MIKPLNTKTIRALGIAGILAVFLLAMVFALSGVDFGTQWDQNLIKGAVNKYVRTGNLLPGEYIYPPMSTYISTTTLVPYVLPSLARYGLNWTPTQRYLLDDVLKGHNQAFLLNLRRVFVFFTLVGILWIGFALAQRDWLAAVIASAVLASSWETNYYSRLVQADGPTMQFVALTLLFGVVALYSKRKRSTRLWLLVAAAVAAAAATATKYTAGIALLMVLILAYYTSQSAGDDRKRTIITLALLGAVYVAAFVIFTPGVLLESSVFFRYVLFDQNTYSGGWGWQTVSVGWDYFHRVMLYLFEVAFSHYPLLALFCSALSLAGIYALFASGRREDRGLALALAGVPLLYILFLSAHNVLFVRNLLMTLPPLAMPAGLGFSFLVKKLRTYTVVWPAALVLVMLVVLVVNFRWLAYAAQTIRLRSSNVFAGEALQAIGERSDQRVYITPAALQLLGDAPLPPNAVTRYSGEEDLVLFAYRGDTVDEEEGSWPVNFPGASPEVFGPQEINLDWYAHWTGSERFVLAPPDLAWQDGALLYKTSLEVPKVDMPYQEAHGLLHLDGQQFILKLDEDHWIYVLNSSNPRVVAALRDLSEGKVTIGGKPYDEKRTDAWYLMSVNGNTVLSEDELVPEYNFSRFYANLSDAQRACLGSKLDPARFLALTDLSLTFVDMPPEELQLVAGCTQGAAP